jgi:signal transduction histidine kinase
VGPVDDPDRQRIVTDLHDSLVQKIAGNAYALAAAASEAEHAGAHDAAESIRAAGAVLRQEVRELRTLMITIAPQRLHDQGLEWAIDDLVSAVRSSDRDIDVDVDLDLPAELGPEVEQLAFRVVQLALRDVVEHPDTRRAVVHAEHEASMLVVTVRHDGRERDANADGGGPSPDATPQRALVLLAAPVHAIGGELRVDVGAGGTHIELCLPY